jgi:hypothetical protein
MVSKASMLSLGPKARRGSKEGAEREQRPSNSDEALTEIGENAASTHKIVNSAYERVPLKTPKQPLQGRGHWFNPSSAHDKMSCFG